MSDKKDISRRKLLATSGALGGALVGIPASAAAAGKGDGEQLTEAELEKMFATMEAGPQASGDGLAMQSQVSDLPEDFEILVGEYQTATVPGDKPYAVESYDEYLARTAPPGFEPVFQESGTVGTAAVGGALEDLYLQEDVGTQKVGGKDLTVGIGLGAKIHGNYSLGVSATLSVDVYLEYGSFSGSIALSSFSLGYGLTENGLCFPFGFKHSVLRELDFEICGDFSLADGPGDSVEVTAGLTLRACADPCPGFTCSYCLPFSANLSGNVTPPEL
ncbi:hypothetical protein E6P09_19005 (plasmid) [Haloferax mediterranei ATCC 33500]|uniref:Uncharacterized protein n=1 Tax=Haloferax mediterranei (strain ATCC 33500 / DSM 1411 / JCM 8866 / NBRC 14739 / NCIMB 2177 / R-4) TaxID=523841 RepID=I3R919_HALMT|nr:hypothetical protein [Haloferax mediterranei]AFK20729.1 hypothetical protein HFX_4034 [Haloferax mediterranei ATCC 33500]AHZ24017.1 hypothetical protein BM92_19630 [Haloferax mediterranei ATCC 33500]ELZ97601.1 hypothetical protein C439_16833 [Haloferax mediterranei ATCC 33500]MDX5989690.1 hypothetical protein [Haloferax mediterranei ATCC 33500]QCQ77408.1 hypothetical protein E6P09_19005 [Haloferax mediterranei ATCC 33500]